MTCHTQREPTHAFGVPWAELTRGRLLKELHPSAMLARGCFVLCKHQCVWTGIESLMFLIVARPKVMRLCSQATYRIFRQHGAGRKKPGGGGAEARSAPTLGYATGARWPGRCYETCGCCCGEWRYAYSALSHSRYLVGCPFLRHGSVGIHQASLPCTSLQQLKVCSHGRGVRANTDKLRREPRPLDDAFCGNA